MIADTAGIMNIASPLPQELIPVAVPLEASNQRFISVVTGRMDMLPVMEPSSSAQT